MHLRNSRLICFRQRVMQSVNRFIIITSVTSREEVTAVIPYLVLSDSSPRNFLKLYHSLLIKRSS